MKSTTSEPIRRPVRSYVIREGRLTRGQERALREYWPVFGVEAGPDRGPLDFNSLFGRSGPVVLEAGFGDGGALRRIAETHPAWNLIGVEVHRPGVGNLLLRLARDKLANVRVIRGDAVDVLRHAIPPDSLHRIHLFFPDPWPKKRHHKRRILTAEFAALAASRLIPGTGVFHFASDWDDYAVQALEVLSACPVLENTVASGGYALRPEWRPETRFERRGRRLGHDVRDIMMRRV
jgi:tRNA (guanine-N7-)-methyltransferase